MAHQVQRMAYVGEIPWHGLGQELTPDSPLDVWAKEAGFEWEAEAQPMFYETPTGPMPVPGKKVLVRSDTRTPLSVVSNDYKPVQPAEILKTFNEIVLASGIFKMETAGCLRGGRKIWALAKAAESVDLGDGDIIKRYALLATSFDKSLPTLFQQTSIRVVCNNTLTAAYWAGGGDREDGMGEPRISFNHLEDFTPEKLRHRMMFDEQWVGFAAALGLCIKVKLSKLGAAEYFKEVLYPEDKADEVSGEVVARNVSRLMDVYADAPGQRLDTARGTLWGAVNAVTFQVDHLARAKSNDVRLDKAWFGAGDGLKNRAMSLAAALAN